MPEIQQWSDIKADFYETALLLGNGASMAIHQGFGYASLRAAAEDKGHFSHEVADVFNAFKTSDFELVLRRLWQATLVNKALGIEPGKVEVAYKQVRQALIATVRDVHIPYKDASKHFEPMYQFMKSFKTVFSLNYDLLVYWAMMASKPEIGNWLKDCFGSGGLLQEDWEKLRENYQADGATLVFYPHGNLMTARCANFIEQKLSTGAVEAKNLLERILELWESGNAVPLFVSEGTSEHKKKSVSSSEYLSRVFREALPHAGTSLVIYGWAMSNQDAHILTQLQGRGSKLRRIAVSVHGGCQKTANKIADALHVEGLKNIVFFDAASPGCWIHPNEQVNP